MLSAWYDRQQPDQVHIQKSPLRASDSASYAELVHRKLGDQGLVHLRWATPGLPVADVNTHPAQAQGQVRFRIDDGRVGDEVKLAVRCRQLDGEHQRDEAGD